jgi:hypothetical protein
VAGYYSLSAHEVRGWSDDQIYDENTGVSSLAAPLNTGWQAYVR